MLDADGSLTGIQINTQRQNHLYGYTVPIYMIGLGGQLGVEREAQKSPHPERHTTNMLEGIGFLRTGVKESVCIPLKIGE